MGDGASDEEIVAAFRTWIELPADATPEQIWAARPSRVAVYRRLRDRADATDFVSALMSSATTAHELEVICEAIIDVLTGRHPETIATAYARSDDELWLTLSNYAYSGASKEAAINIAQAVEIYAWMGGSPDPDEGRGRGRYNDAAFSKVSDDIRNPSIDPVPLLAMLLHAAQSDDELGFIGAGPFEDAYDYRKEHRARILEVARAVPEWIPMLEGR